MEELKELLSLANFEPDKAYEPYLNTPRSLEACRMNGVNPIELVEVDISEFQKDFPNDPDAVQRRFERVDGARKRVLNQVIQDWKLLCASGWEPPLAAPKDPGETIVQVSGSAHCRLLELQAARFRKMEKDNWDSLNREMKMEIRAADIEQKNKKITAKHDEIQNSNDTLKKERQLMREELHRQQMERQKKKEEDFWAETRKLQEMDRLNAQQKQENDLKNRIRDKQFRERREMERIQREEYTKQLKNSIMSGLQNQTDQKKKMLEVRDKSTLDRLTQHRMEKERYMAQKREDREERLRRAKLEQEERDEQEKKEMMEQIAKNEAKRQAIKDNRERERLELLNLNEDATKEKLNKIRKANDDHVNGKAERTLDSMRRKEELARQELERVREAQEKRRTIKAIRQEAFRMAQLRAKKSQDYKMLKMSADVRSKEERCDAIKKGFFALNHMRNSMKDIMATTQSTLRLEMHNLRHKDNFSPDKVVDRALNVGEKVLFPRLQRTFGIVDEKYGPGGSLTGGGADLFPSEFKATTAGSTGAGTAGKSGGEMFLNDEIIPPRATTPGAGASGGTVNTAVATGTLNATAGSTAPAGVGRPSATGKTGTGSSSTGRKGFTPLPIKAMTADQLTNRLKESKNHVLIQQDDAAAEERKKQQQQQGTWSNDFFEGELTGFDDYDSDAGSKQSQQSPPKSKAILKLPDGDAASDSPTASPATGKGGKLPPAPISPQRNLQSRAGTSDSNSRRAATANSASSSRIGTAASSSQQRRSARGGGGGGGAGAEDVKLPPVKFDPLGDSAENTQRDEPFVDNSTRTWDAQGDLSLQPKEGGGDRESAARSEMTPAATPQQQQQQQLQAPTRAESPTSSNKEQRTAAAAGMDAMASSPSAKIALSKKLSYSTKGAPRKEVRTDVNEKAKFLEPPPGKFRREFSMDHPLADGGTGKYKTEIKKGMAPTGLQLENAKKMKNSVAKTVETANKIEKLTYTAQRRVADPKGQVEELKAKQNAILKEIIMTERDAEMQRDQTLRSVTDPQERANLEAVFAEERSRASNRIITATREHEEIMKQTVLAMMDLGGPSMQ